ncbi:regulator of protease activity HflC (stomatin/prohibitin superfamily) [Aeromicrobium panaciterrae]|uniref:Regulator of protease activity HflC (Stomatin/prohibitin superfamily) n=1 Tax=Aeromicrobium panaciterrae TaxID=363861 RepID=A0ABU1UP85_9ACTN|nr:SPFH domain-containing protein [Aeromicrobium panaciterrae]MDR7086971.1 regulator of protease activity HflC (stomatin/prohibitin superfamily) [Aeromicrobium panaciterrae]
MSAALAVLVALAVLAIAVVSMTVKIVPQARAGIVERFGKYRTTLPAGLNIVMPFVDKVRYMIDLREQVVSFPPQPVITEDNLVVSIDTVIYFQVTDPVAATYEIANYIQAIEQLTMTTLRNITGGMTLEHALTSRDQINAGLRGELDSATGKWGIRVNRVELKGIDPPPTIIDAMEKQMRAERDKRAMILTAEGDRQSAILMAEGQKQSAILTAEGNRQAAILTAQADRQAQILRAQGEAQAIQTVFQAIHDGNPDQKLLSYQYLQMLPKIAEGDNATTWIIPAELTKALGTLGGTFGKIPVDGGGNKTRIDFDAPIVDDAPVEGATAEAVQQALDAAKAAESAAPVAPATPVAETPPEAPPAAPKK